MINRTGRATGRFDRDVRERELEPPRTAAQRRLSLHAADRFDGAAQLASAGGSTRAGHESFFEKLLDFLSQLFSGSSTSQPPVSQPDPAPVSEPSSTPPVAQPSDPSVAAANQFFLTQLAGSPWNTSGGGTMDCGPTSGLMVLSALGLAQRPDPSQAAGAIDDFRGTVDQYEGLGARAGGDDTVGVTVQGLEGALQARGATVQELPASSGEASTTLAAIDAQLDAGAKVIAYGDPSQAWEPELGASYQAQGSFSHFVAIFGRSADGNYLVGDPLSTSGVVEATPDELSRYIQGGLQLDPPFGGAFAVSK